MRLYWKKPTPYPSLAISGPNLVFLTWTGDGLWYRQTQNGVNLDWSLMWPWKSRSIASQNNRDLNQGLLHLWSKLGDPSLNEFQVIARTSKWLTHRWTHGHRQRQYPEAKNSLWWKPMITIHVGQRHGYWWPGSSGHQQPYHWLCAITRINENSNIFLKQTISTLLQIMAWLAPSHYLNQC